MRGRRLYRVRKEYTVETLEGVVDDFLGGLVVDVLVGALLVEDAILL